MLNQKSELHKALEKYKDTQAKKEIMRQKLESKSVLEKAIEERAKKLEMVSWKIRIIYNRIDDSTFDSDSLLGFKKS